MKSIFFVYCSGTPDNKRTTLGAFSLSSFTAGKEWAVFVVIIILVSKLILNIFGVTAIKSTSLCFKLYLTSPRFYTIIT